MTKEQFIDYLNLFNKKAGEYSQYEQDKLGLAFREVENKHWAEFIALVAPRREDGSFYSAETFRLHIKNIVYVKAPDNPLIKVSGDDLDQLDTRINTKLEDLFIKKVKVQDLTNSYRRTLRDEARIDSLKDCIKESVKQLPKLSVITTPKNKDFTNEAVLLLSDWHIGVNVDNFYNKFNTNVATQRLSILVSKVNSYCKQHGVKRLNVLNCGDLIHGIIHISARIEQEFDVISQVITASELLAQTLNELQKSGAEILYRSVSDNHARITPDKTQHIEKENLNRLIDWYLQERLKNTNIKFIFDNLDYGLGEFELLNGKKVAFAHGHEDTPNKVFQNFVGATRGFVDYICLAHYHASKLTTTQDSKIIINGSLCGTEQYALSKRLFSTPEQLLLVFNEDDLITIAVKVKEV